MKKIFAILLITASLFLITACGTTEDTGSLEGDSSVDITTGSTTPQGELSTLMQENAQLMLQAGQMGIDASKRSVWSSQAQAASQKIAMQDYSGAIIILQQLNAQMRAEIAAYQQ